MLVRRPAPARTGILAMLPALLAGVSTALHAGTASATPVTVPTAVADALKGQGQGLCVANAVSMTPSIDFPQMAGVFNTGINAFMEAHKADRVEYVQRTIFDLSNNQDTGPKISWGDFTNAMMPKCQTGGCDFYKNDTTTSFASRFRGFFNVTATMANQPIHIGFYADDGVSLTFYDKSGNAYPVMTQPPVLGAPTWRLTETVTFAKQGLYPIEIQFVEIVEHAALEMSVFTGTFTDFQLPANQVPVVSLNASGFTLLPETAFFQTLSGTPSYPNLDQCKQCDRQFVGQFGNNGCDSGYYCNEAALCAPCDTAIYCGLSCSPCGGMTPFCINTNGQQKCGQCRDDLDCKAGFSCDAATHVCNECNLNSDCDRGKECVQHACQWCGLTEKTGTPNTCAGNSCNCCPKGSNGKQMTCRSLDPSAPPECTECSKDADCTQGVCDVLIGQCVPSHAPNESTGCCGDGCVQCPSDNPLCLPGPFGTACAACRNDMQCPAGTFCIEGQCSACTTDRHCGKRCETCSGDTPFCNHAQVAKDAACVRCTKDDECNGGKCDPAKHTCAPACVMTCAPATPYCDGTACVECYADTQCPCNGTCDLTTHTCGASCKGNADCLGGQHCQHADNGTGTQSCAPGPLPDNTSCGGTLASACSGNSIGSRGTDPTPPSGIVALGLMGLWLRRRARRRA